MEITVKGKIKNNIIALKIFEKKSFNSENISIYNQLNKLFSSLGKIILGLKALASSRSIEA